MYSYISGELVEFDESHVVVDNNGIGYEINTASSILNDLPAVGSQVKIYTVMLQAKDDVAKLYGFASKDNVALFNLLLTVSGVGPKAALSILSVMDADALRFAIISGDSKAIAKAPGVGKRTAERLLVDLKDKIDAFAAVDSKLNNSAISANKTVNASVRQEVIMALTGLGYTPSDAAKALDKMTITESTTTEQLLTDTLRQMSFL